MKNFEQKLNLPGNRRLAAPSWVKTASLAENCAFLSDQVDEVGLLFFTSAPSLAYGEKDLPAQLVDLPLSWHVHLPSDLDWNEPGQAADTCLQLMAKLDFLGVRRAVLHPPPSLALPDKVSQPLRLLTPPADNAACHNQGRLSCNAQIAIAGLRWFVEAWSAAGRDPLDILLENQPENDLELLARSAKDLGCSLCLDLAHFLLHAEESNASASTGQSACPPVPAPETLEQVRLLHLCAPEAPRPGSTKRGGHAALTALGPEENALGRAICRTVQQDTVFMLELFQWERVCDSFPLLYDWLSD